MQKCVERFGKYETVKVVQLKDGKLALVRLFALAGCLVYVLGSLFMSHKYAKFVSPTGQVAIEYASPANASFSNNHSYCNDAKNGGAYPPGAVFDCQVWDPLQVTKTQLNNE